MKYAKEVIELMSAYPHREFKMKTIVQYIKPSATVREKRTTARQVRRVLNGLVENGTVVITNHRNKIGGHAYYWWS